MNFEFPCIDPVAIDIPGIGIDIRWYGLTYVVGFLCAELILSRLAQRRFLPVDRATASDLLFWSIIGVMVGGRLGFALFYDHELLDPVRIFQFWKGGMSFHGGLLGVFVAFILFARRHGVPWRRVGDSAAIAVTPGIFFVRGANFVNGELFGRTTSADTFGAMRFPTDPAAVNAMGLGDVPDMRSRELARLYACGEREWEEILPRLATDVDWESKRPRLDWDAVQTLVPYRHPSQLYEGLTEGLLLGLILLALLVWTRRRPLGAGAYGGVFLLGYGIARSALELVRQPDAQFVTAENPGGTVFMGLTMGQTLSSVMILAGQSFKLIQPRPQTKFGCRLPNHVGDTMPLPAGRSQFPWPKLTVPQGSRPNSAVALANHPSSGLRLAP
ncbi:MAG: prolipoprotein diacylglyceryl transferase [Spirulina sp. SIO3F2]|nr:prolipoprotein diacylglyceryl transferase [Spirulina sp. SIO3F2]